VVAIAVLAIATSGCAFVGRAGGGGRGGPEPAIGVHVGPPGLHGARVVDVTVPWLAPTSPATVELRVDQPFGRPVATSSSVPAHLVLDVSAIGPGRHVLFASVRSGRRHATRAVLLSTALRLNQMQVLATHNSYHVAPGPPFSAVPDWQYTHDPLDVQFATEGVRQIELDVYADPTSIKVMHVPDVDAGTTCPTLVACLRVVKTWSDAHPRHVPIGIQLELKDDPLPLPTPILPWDAAAMDHLDTEIRSVFPRTDLVTPDDVRGRHATLADAITSDGWPTLDASRGRVMFVMDNAEPYRSRYAAGHPSLRGRVIFTNSAIGRDDAAFIKLNDPIADGAQIDTSVADGYLVRTRADADTVEARVDDTRPRDAALASGAQWVSTDFPVPGRAFGTPYFVTIPGGTPARCNPVNAPAWCTSAMVEALGHP
jgi:hypothetical protein